jgi:hypothetical protein
VAFHLSDLPVLLHRNYASYRSSAGSIVPSRMFIQRDRRGEAGDHGSISIYISIYGIFRCSGSISLSISLCLDSALRESNLSVHVDDLARWVRAFF